MIRRILLHAAEVALLAVVAVVLPATVSDTGLYLELAGPCLIAAALLGCLEALRHR